MAKGDAEAVLDIRTESGSYFADMDKAEKRALSLGTAFERAKEFFEGFGRGVNQVGKDIEKSTQSAESFGASIGKIIAGFVSAQAIIGAARAVWSGITGAITDSVKAAGDAEKSHAQVAAALRTQGTAIPSVVKAFQDYAEKLQQTTIYQDDVVESAEALLVQVGNVMPRDMKKALQATTELASGLGKDLPEAAMLVAKAAEGNVTALKKAGVVIDETKAKQEGFGYVLDQITAKFGGQAAALAGTYQGRLAQLANTWNNVQESIGRAITTNATMLKLIEEVTGAVGANTKELSENRQAVNFISDAIILAVRSVALFAEGVDLVQTSIEALILGARRGAQALGNIAIEALAFVRVAALSAGNMTAYQEATAMVESLQKAVTELGERNAATKARSDEWGNALQGIAGKADALAKRLEETRGKTIQMADAADGGSDAWKRHTRAIEDTGKAIESIREGLKALNEKLTPLAGTFALVSDQAKVYGEEAAKLAQQADLLGLKVPASVRAVATAWNSAELTKIFETISNKWNADLDKFIAEAERKLETGSKAMADAIIKNDAIVREAQRATIDLTQQRALTAAAFQFAQLQRSVQAQKAAVDTVAGNAIAAFQAIDDKATASAIDIATVWVLHLQEIENATNSWRNLFIDWLNQIPRLLQQAFTGGGGLSGGLKAITSGLGAVVGSKLFEAGGPLSELGNKLSLFLGDKLGKGVGTAFGLALPGIGAVLGSLAGPLLGNLFDKIFNTEEKQVNKTRQAFVDAAGGLDALNRKAAAAGVTLTAMLNAKTVKDYEQAIKDLNDALDFQKQAMEDLDATVQKYKFSTEELGPALEKQNLDKQAQEIYHDWMVLTAAGINVSAVAREMGENINDFVQRAIKSGFEVPMAMRPILEEMIRLGQLTDENGNKITNLDGSGIKFSMTMSEGFQALIKSVDRLTAAIARALGISVDLAKEWSAMPPPPSFPGDGTGDTGNPPAAQAFASAPAVRFASSARFIESGRGVTFDGRNSMAAVQAQLARIGAGGNADVVRKLDEIHHALVSRPNQLIVDSRIVAEAAMDGVHAGGAAQSKFRTQVQRHVR